MGRATRSPAPYSVVNAVMRNAFKIAPWKRKVIAMPQPALSIPTTGRQTELSEVPAGNEAYSSGVSWAAVIGGAFVSASLALILLSLRTGLGLSSVSPWSNAGASASTISAAAIAWLIVTQIVAAAMGGYLAGRLRTKWTHVHTDEVYFRDTAHGFLVWAVGLVITATLLASAAASIVGGSAQRTGNANTLTGEAEQGSLNPNAYFVDELLRTNGAAGDRAEPLARGEVERILARAVRQGAMPPTDSAYLAQMVSARSGLSPADAEKRVSDVFEGAQQSTDNARKALAHLSLWLFVALLSGAFFASYAGTIGGKQRDRVTV
jgi:hypothetical protein